MRLVRYTWFALGGSISDYPAVLSSLTLQSYISAPYQSILRVRHRVLSYGSGSVLCYWPSSTALQLWPEAAEWNKMSPQNGEKNSSLLKQTLAQFLVWTWELGSKLRKDKAATLYSAAKLRRQLYTKALRKTQEPTECSYLALSLYLMPFVQQGL